MKTDSRNTAESRPWRALALWSTVVPAAILLALAVAPFAAAHGSAASSRRHQRCRPGRRHCPKQVDKRMMKVSSSLSGGGTIELRLRWVSAPTAGGAVGPRLLIQSVSMSNVPAGCSTLAGEAFTNKHTTELSDFGITNAVIEIPGRASVGGNVGLEMIVRVNEYEEDLHDLHGDAFIAESEPGPEGQLASCIALNYPANWEARLPHDWYGR